MKSYKDLDKDIILNAPEGAMWWCSINKQYYKLKGSTIYYLVFGGWMESVNFPTLAEIQRGQSGYVNIPPIPLPNIEIPWEATEDSKCPVPYGTKVYIKWADYECEDNNPGIWNWKTLNLPITAYKIIDEDYLKESAQDEVVEVPELEMHRAAYQAIKSAGFESPEELLAQHKCLLGRLVGDTSEDKLIKRLEFLQNLANKFPEIRDEAIKFMNCELEGFMNTLWENEESE